jgi:flagellin
MASTVSLTKGIRPNVLNLLDTQAQLLTVENRINTGKRINGVTDGPRDFFQAQSLSTRSANFTKVTGNIETASSQVNAAIAGLNAVNDLLDTLTGALADIRDGAALTDVSNAAVAFQTYRSQITNVAVTPTFLGKKLLLSGASFPTAVGVNLDTNTLFELSINTFNLTLNSGTAGGNDSANGVSLQNISGAQVSNFYLQSSNTAVATQADLLITNAENQVATAQAAVQSALQQFATAATVLGLRKDFVSKYQRILDDGQNRIVAADTTVEGANLSALQTRQQLGYTALSIATQSEQGILRLFQ